MFDVKGLFRTFEKVKNVSFPTRPLCQIASSTTLNNNYLGNNSPHNRTCPDFEDAEIEKQTRNPNVAIDTVLGLRLSLLCIPNSTQRKCGPSGHMCCSIMYSYVS